MPTSTGASSDSHVHPPTPPIPVICLAPGRDQLRQNLIVKRYLLEVDMDHLAMYSEELAHQLRQHPAEVLLKVTPAAIMATL